jgi:DNA-binding GntR family transcriptional regulator
MAARPLPTVSAVEALASVLRAEILAGTLEPGEHLREQQLAATYGVARHTLRAALQVLAGEGLVRIEPNRGASVAVLDAEQLTQLFELRTALEVEAARLALQRNGGRLPTEVHDHGALLAAAARRRGAAWGEVGAAHDALHQAIVDASASPRIVAAYGALAAEMRLFVLQLQPTWSGRRMAADHEALLTAIERDGPEAIRAHIDDGLHSLVDQVDSL